MNYKTIALSLLTLIAFASCSDSKTTKTETAVVESKEAVKTIEPIKVTEVKKEFTIDEIYNNMCIECHASNGSGNTEKLTPTMIGQTQEDIRNSLVEIEKDKGHIIMEHNRGEILKKGMEYSADEMAKYMYKRFTN